MEVLTADFCQWLLKNKLTNLRVSLNRKVEIDFKPPVIVKPKTTPGKIESPKEM